MTWLVRTVVFLVCVAVGIVLLMQFVTLYAFSTENWSRPVDEVASLMEVTTGSTWTASDKDYFGVPRSHWSPPFERRHMSAIVCRRLEFRGNLLCLFPTSPCHGTHDGRDGGHLHTCPAALSTDRTSLPRLRSRHVLRSMVGCARIGDPDAIRSLPPPAGILPVLGAHHTGVALMPPADPPQLSWHSHAWCHSTSTLPPMPCHDY